MMATIDTTSRRTWQNVNSKRRLQSIQNGQEGKGHQKKRDIKFFIYRRPTLYPLEIAVDFLKSL
jgi:hypothetical protein